MHGARRRLLIASSALLAPSALFAQPRPKVVRIGLLGPTWSSPEPMWGSFREALRGFGYAEGRDVVFESRSARGEMAKLPELARELVQRNVDVIVAGGTVSAEAARAATSTIPIVAHGVADLAESGLVASLARPGGNVTGVAVAFPETAAKQMEIMLEVIPHGKRVAVLWPGPRTAFVQSMRKELEARVASRFELTWHAPRTQGELQSAFRTIQGWRPDFMLVLSSPFFYGQRNELAAFAARARIPAAYGFREYVDAGGLISYGASLEGSLVRAAAYVDKILRGAKPADLPVEMPSKLELAVNTKAAQALDLRIPQSVLARADILVR